MKSSRRPPRLVALAAAAGGLVHDHRRLPAAGFAVLPPLQFARSKATPLLVWSSLVCIGFGLVHLRGLLQVRPQL